MKADSLKIAVGVCGASGICVGLKALEILAELNAELFICFSGAAKNVLRQEENSDYEAFQKSFSKKYPSAKFYDESDFSAPIASGSFYFDAMLVCPMSMKTLGAVANGMASNLISRAADVALKERRRLVAVPRETPLALSHLKNMCELSRAGAVVMPPCPSFYTKPKTAADIVENIALRAVSALGLRPENQKQWGI